MSVNKGPANIVNMQDERARRDGGDLPLGEYEHIGAALKAMREASGLSQAELAERTHIKERHLEAIENLDRDALPARPYAIGFVKSYAEFLDLDANAVVARFKEDVEYTVAAPVEPEKFEAAEAAAEAEPANLSVTALFLVMAFILWCAWLVTRPQEIVTPGAIGVAPVAEEPGGDAIIEPDAALAAPLSENVVEARIIERVEPVYPMSCATAAKPLETVVVGYVITAGGAVSGERIIQSSNACFDAAALNAIRRWEFEPRSVDGAARPAFDQKFNFAFQRPQ